MHRKIKNLLKDYWILILAILVAITAIALNFTLNDIKLKQSIINNLIIALGSIMVVTSGIDMLKSILKGSYGIDILAITAILACLAIGQYWAAYVIVLMLSGGEALETLAAKRARKELSKLIKRQPQTAHLLKANGQVKSIAIDKIKIGDNILVKPSEIVPIDGRLVTKSAELDESAMTGESIPVIKTKGEKIISGTLNRSTAITIKVTALLKDSYYSRIIKLVKDAESSQSRFVNMANRYAIPFTLLSYTIAGLAWILSGDATRFAEVLVVSSPCPLILAAPIAFISGRSIASRYGIIVKDSAALELTANAKIFAFDKTGTLTSGKIKVAKVEANHQYTPENVISFAASAESFSSHVLAVAVTNYAKNKKINTKVTKNAREIPGQGIFANIDNKKCLVGSLDFLKNNKIKDLPLELSGKTNINVAVNGYYAGTLYLDDTIKPNAKNTLKNLLNNGVSKIIMLTGDNHSSAKKTAGLLNITDFYAKQSPLDKVNIVSSLKQSSKDPIIMVGDGINDAPVLAKANVGIALGSMGSTIANESADVVITSPNINRIAVFQKISQHTINIARQSIIYGIVLCLFLEILASFGFIPALIGAFFQEVIDVVVIVNALRVHRAKIHLIK